MAGAMIVRAASGSVVAAAKQTPVARAFSAAATASDDSYNYVKARRAYRAEIKVLRAQFIDEVARRKEQQARDAEAQRLKIMKEKAARLEIKRQQQAIRAAEVAREKALHEERVRQYFEEKVLVREARNAEVEKRREALVATLADQHESWITADNFAEKLQEDVFTYSTDQVATRASFDPAAASGSAVSWLEKLQRMKPAGFTASEAESEDKEEDATDGADETGDAPEKKDH